MHCEIVNFPALKENPYKTRLRATHKILAQHQPELIILGKSMVIQRARVAEIRVFVNAMGLASSRPFDCK